MAGKKPAKRKRARKVFVVELSAEMDVTLTIEAKSVQSAKKLARSLVLSHTRVPMGIRVRGQDAKSAGVKSGTKIWVYSEESFRDIDIQDAYEDN